MWKSADVLTGFEVTYKVTDSTKYVGWPPYKHMFGTPAYNSEFETFDFTGKEIN